MSLDFFKDLFFGRNVEVFDNLVFRLSGHRLTGWSIANKLKNRWLGRGSSVSHEPLIVVGGCPRSGTTLLQMMLKVHDDIDGPYREVCLFEDCEKLAKLATVFELDETTVAALAAESQGDATAFAASILETYRSNKGIRRVVLKAPKAIFLFRRLARFFPEMRFIHVIRDGRDASISMQSYFHKQSGKTFPFSYGAKTWAASMNEAAVLRESTLNYTEVRYEDLITGPEETMTALFEFLGEPGVDIQKVLDFSQHIDAGEIETHRDSVSRPLNSAALDRWKTELTEDDAAVFSRFAGKELVTMGYDD